MIKTIDFNRVTKFTGRNGYFNASGLELMENSNNTVMITPLTTKGKQPARCDIEIPKESIPILIYYLEEMYKDKYRVKVLPGHSAKSDQIIDGYLAWNGEICRYGRGQAIKKARLFGGKIEKI